MSTWLPLGTALVVGFVHALEIDHMLAVTTFVTRRPALATAARFGFRWGVGHSIAVLAAGGILLATGLQLGSAVEGYGEAAVGLMLAGLGFWSLRATRNLHVHSPSAHGAHDHVHVHVHPAGEREHTHGHAHVAHPPDPHPTAHHRHGITLVGLLHGLAGTSAVVALIPVTLLGSRLLGVAYLVAFSLGVTAGMTVYALVAAMAVRRAVDRSLEWGQRVARAVAACAVLLGVWWIWRALA